MPTQQGSLDLLNDPIAQELLNAPIPMHLSYVWTDGTPRVVPIGFHWNGSELVIGGPPEAPKMKVLQEGQKVAVSIDSYQMPYHVLLIRGTVHISMHEGIIPEYRAYCYRYMGKEGGDAWLAQVSGLISHMARIAVKPEWAAIMDFEARFPSAVEKAIEAANAL